MTHQQFQQQLQKQQQHPNTIGVNDVLLGRGGATNSHEGNRRYRAIVSQHQGEYLAAKKKEKVLIARKIVAVVHDNGGRFLKRDPGNVWVEVPNKRATEKTSQALREGLDVRNHTVRPRKLTKRHMEKTPSRVVVTGWVMPQTAQLMPKHFVTTAAMVSPTVPMVSPAVVSVYGETSSVPDLYEEKLTLMPQQKQKQPETMSSSSPLLSPETATSLPPQPVKNDVCQV